jgi:hypothetical protein
MKVFRELLIHTNQQKLEEIVSTLEKELPNNWIRNKVSEKKIESSSSIKYYIFTCDNTNSLESASVFLVKNKDDNYRIGNIVPKDLNKLSKDQYNAILVSIYNLLRPICENFKVEITISTDDQSIEDWLTESSSKKLKSFSILANKSTGSGHPSDEERWFSFIVSVHINNDKISTTRLSNWLMEQGWHEDTALQLIIEFEQGLSLLKYYTDNCYGK